MHLRHLLSTALLLLAALSQAADFTPSGGRPYSAAVRLAVGTDFVMTSGGIAIPRTHASKPPTRLATATPISRLAPPLRATRKPWHSSA